MNFTDFSHSEIVISIIAFFTAIGAIFQFAAFIRYSNEIKYTKRLDERIADHLNEDSPTILPSSELIESEQVPVDSMAATRARELEKFSQYPGMVALHDLGAVAAEADAGRIKNAIPNMLIASLLVFGLFGTLLSLRETLGDPALEKFIAKDGGASTATFQESLGPVLKGFKQAFTASIYGVGGTIALLVIRIFVRARREKCFEVMEHFVVQSLLPYYIEPEKTQLEKAAASLTEVNVRFRDISAEMDKSAHAISVAVASLESAMGNAAKAFGEDGSVAYQLQKFTEQAEKFTQSTDRVGDAHEKISEMLSDLGGKQNELIEKQESRIASTEENRKKLTERLSNFIKSVSEDNQRLAEEFSSGIQGLIDSQEKATREAAERGKAEKGHLESLVKSLGEGQEELIKSLHETYEETSKQIVLLNRDLVEENRISLGEVVSDFKILSTQLEKIILKEDRVDIEAFNEFRSYLGSIQESMQSVIIVNNEAVDKAHNMHQKLDQQMMNSFEDFSERISTLARIIDKIAEAGSIEHENMKDKFLNLFRKH